MGIAAYMKFNIEEYKRRYREIQTELAGKNLDGLLITEGSNFTYFSGGTKDFSYSRPHILLIPRNAEPIAIIQNFPSWNRTREIWFDDVRVYDTMLGLPLEIVLKAMRDAGMDSGKIGMELGYEQRLGISLNDFNALRQSLPKVEFIDAADIIWKVRIIKTPEEIARHRRACQITAQAYDALFPGLYEGISEVEIVDRFLRLQTIIGGYDPWAFINSGPENYNGGGGGPTKRRIRRGDQVWVDGGCSYRGYGSDFCCAGTVGPPAEEQVKMQKMVEEITRNVVATVKPGIKACDINETNNEEWSKRGYDYNEINWGGGRIGHGLGFEPPHIASYDDTIIKPGMVFTIEPGINTEYGCYQAEMDIAITQSGCEILNEMDRSLRTIPV
jgi:Xaa-Pro aminopeptidase